MPLRHIWTSTPADLIACGIWLERHLGPVIASKEHAGNRNGQRHCHWVVEVQSHVLPRNFYRSWRTVYPAGRYDTKLCNQSDIDKGRLLAYVLQDDCERQEDGQEPETQPMDEVNDEGGSHNEAADEFATWCEENREALESLRTAGVSKLRQAVNFVERGKNKPNVGELHVFCRTNNIVDRAAFDKHPEAARFLGLYGLNGHLANIFGMVTARGSTTPIDIDEVVFNNQGELFQPSDSKIFNFLTNIQGWTAAQTFLFGRVMVGVANRETGKKNCIWVHGVSNAGKTRLIKSFVDIYFAGNVGIPDNTPKTGFKWGNCVNKRVIMWDEPYCQIEDSEIMKLILGGEPANVQVKYQSACMLPPTPVYVTANKRIHQVLCVDWQAARSVWDNRMYTFSMRVVCPPEQCENLLNLNKFDWDQFICLCKMNDDRVARGVKRMFDHVNGDGGVQVTWE